MSGCSGAQHVMDKPMPQFLEMGEDDQLTSRERISGCIDELMEEDIEAGRRELLDDGGVVGVTIPRVFNGTVERVALEALFERNVEDGNVKSDCMVLRERERVWSG